jgi:hypothetical protein
MIAEKKSPADPEYHYFCSRGTDRHEGSFLLVKVTTLVGLSRRDSGSLPFYSHWQEADTVYRIDNVHRAARSPQHDLNKQSLIQITDFWETTWLGSPVCGTTWPSRQLDTLIQRFKRFNWIVYVSVNIQADCSLKKSRFLFSNSALNRLHSLRAVLHWFPLFTFGTRIDARKRQVFVLFRLCFGYLKEIDHLEDQGIVGSLIIKWILEKQGVCAWTEFIWLRIQFSGGVLWPL